MSNCLGVQVVRDQSTAQCRRYQSCICRRLNIQSSLDQVRQEEANVRKFLKKQTVFSLGLSAVNFLLLFVSCQFACCTSVARLLIKTCVVITPVNFHILTGKCSFSHCIVFPEKLVLLGRTKQNKKRFNQIKSRFTKYGQLITHKKRNNIGKLKIQIGQQNLRISRPQIRPDGSWKLWFRGSFHWNELRCLFVYIFIYLLIYLLFSPKLRYFYVWRPVGGLTTGAKICLVQFEKYSGLIIDGVALTKSLNSKECLRFIYAKLFFQFVK